MVEKPRNIIVFFFFKFLAYWYVVCVIPTRVPVKFPRRQKKKYANLRRQNNNNNISSNGVFRYTRMQASRKKIVFSLN